jgi:YD repeat-containing protein
MQQAFQETITLTTPPDPPPIVIAGPPEDQNVNQGRSATRDDAFPGTLRFGYDDVFNQLSVVIDELGHLTLYDIDPANGNRRSIQRVIGQEDNEDNGETDDLITEFMHTQYGLVDKFIDPLGRVTNFIYDFDLGESPRGLLRRIVFAEGTPDEAFQEFEYDAAGNLMAFIDEEGNRREFQYDEMNRLVRIIEPDPD